MMLPKF